MEQQEQQQRDNPTMTSQTEYQEGSKEEQQSSFTSSSSSNQQSMTQQQQQQPPPSKSQQPSTTNKQQQSTSSGSKNKTEQAVASLRGKVAVVLAGFPNKLTEKLAEAAVKRGHHVASVGLGIRGYSDSSTRLPGVSEPINVIDSSLPNAKQLLSDAIQDLQTKENMEHVIAIDCAIGPEAVGLFNELNLPFVHHGAQQNSADSNRLLETTRLARTPSVISPFLSRESANLQLMLRNFARTSPGLFEDWTLDSFELLPSYYTMNPFSRDILESFSLLTNRAIDTLEADLTGHAKPEGQTFDEAIGHQKFTLRDGRGSTEFTLTFRQDSNGDPEGVMDMADFLLSKLQEQEKQQEESNSPRVWALQDWAQPLTFLTI